MAKKAKKVSGFQMNKKMGHPSYAYKQKREWVTSLGFTHDPDEKHGKKTKLKHNINPNDNEKCYVKNKAERYKSNFYKSKPEYKEYRIHADDKLTREVLIQSNKKSRQSPTSERHVIVAVEYYPRYTDYEMGKNPFLLNFL